MLENRTIVFWIVNAIYLYLILYVLICKRVRRGFHYASEQQQRWPYHRLLNVLFINFSSVVLFW